MAFFVVAQSILDLPNGRVNQLHKILNRFLFTF